jgi:hypothetical protein
MNLDQAELALIEARNIALCAWGNRLLDEGLTADDPAFAAKLIKYARELEAWRISAMARICRVVEAVLIERGDAPMQ